MPELLDVAAVVLALLAATVFALMTWAGTRPH
jgi:hypothetical protein